MANARQLIEVYTGPSKADIDAAVQIIRYGNHDTWQEANVLLEPHWVAFNDSWPILIRSGAIAGFDADTGFVLLNANGYRYCSSPTIDWRTVIEHELTHRGQMLRAYQRGGNLAKIVKSHEKYFLGKHGEVRMDRYTTHPLEMQALARNAVSKAKTFGRDPAVLMRRGELGQYAPLAPGDRKRFGKYAYQMLQGESFLLPFTDLIMEQAMLLVGTMLNEEVIRVCAACEEEIGPQKGNPADKSHTSCRRHAIAKAMADGFDEYAARIRTMPDEAFAPDLVERPELVDLENKAAFDTERARFRAWQDQHLQQLVARR